MVVDMGGERLLPRISTICNASFAEIDEVPFSRSESFTHMG